MADKPSKKKSKKQPRDTGTVKGVFGVLDRIAYGIYHRTIERNPGRYYSVEKNLKQAKKAVPVEVYVPRALLFATFSMIAGAVIGIILSTFLSKLDWSFIPVEILQTLFTNHLFMIVMCGGLFAGLGFAIVYYTFLMAPKISASSRVQEIDGALTDAIVYMFAMSQGGKDMLEMFRVISEHPNIFKELSKEAASLVREVELLGVDLQTALHNLAIFTPGKSFKEFLESLASIVATGGDMPVFFRSRAEQLRLEASTQNRLLLETLSLFAEIYVTALVAGPLFMLVILIMLGVMGGVDLLMIGMIIYLFIPVGSGMFVVLLKITGMDDDSIQISMGRLKKKKEKEILPDGISKEELQRAKAMSKADSRVRFNKFIKSPMKGFKMNPYLILIFSVPAAVIFILPQVLKVWGFSMNVMISYLDDFIIISLFIALVPFTLFYEMRVREVKKINAAIPEFLKRLANLNSSGLSVPKALRALLKSNLGILNEEVRQITNQIEWGSSTTEALEDFAKRVQTLTVTRLITLINRAAEYTSDLRETLSIAASDALTTDNLKNERYAGTLMYTMIIYISFGVFVYIIYTLAAVFLPMLPGGSGSTTPGSGMFSLGIGIDTFNMLFYHACVIMGFSSGIVGGQIGNGNLVLGLKHGLLMVLVSFIMFNIVISN